MAKDQLTIALCMIAKDNADVISRVLDSTEKVFDAYYLQDTGSTDDTVEVFEKWCKKNKKQFKTSKRFVGKSYKYVEIDGKKVLGDFAKARNNSFDMAKKSGHDFAFWLDTDDILKGARNIPQLIKNMDKDGIHNAIMTYVYAKGPGGLRAVTQKRERIIDIRLKGKWANRVHENYQIKGEHKVTDVPEGSVIVEHLRTPFESINTGRRNHLIMLQQLKEEGIKNFDDNMLHNLAFDHWERAEHKEAIKYYEIILEERKDKYPIETLFKVIINTGKSYLELGDIEKAIIYGYRAKKLDRNTPEPYLLLAQCFSIQGEWEDTIRLAKQSLEVKVRNTIAPVNEMEIHLLPRKLLEHAYMQVGMMKEAKAMSDEIVKISPMAINKSTRGQIDLEIKRKKAIQGIGSLVRYIQDTNDYPMLDRVHTAIPLALKEDDSVRAFIQEIQADYKRKTRHVKFEGSKNIILYAGPHYEPWDGNADKEKGIGGSEGMTIQLSRELAALGNKVTIYGEPGESIGKEIDGVLYEHHSKWKPEMKCDVFISLRNPGIFAKVIAATKQYLWLHDTEYGDHLEPVHFYTPNKTIILSDSHKQIIKANHNIEDDSIFWQTRNAVNKFAVEYGDKNAEERNPYQMIYASSYDRGLDNLLAMWPTIKEAIPEATLKIFYGWNTYDAMMERRVNTPQGDQMKAHKSSVLETIAGLEGVQELGRVTQNELYKEFAESSIWLYPTTFYEISCINAMTAQAMGAVPVCTPEAALKETVSSKHGVKVELSEMTDAVIHLLSNQEELEAKRKPMMKWARKQYDIVALAKDWDKLFNED